MAAFHEDPERKVVPRWRSFDTTLALGELLPIVTGITKDTGEQDFLTSKLRRWGRQKGVRAASELVGAAIVLDRADEAIEAAKFLRIHAATDSARLLAQRLLSQHGEIDSPSLVEPQDHDVSRHSRQVHLLRQQLHRDPRDAFLWMDLALSYVAVDLHVKAERAVRVALDLAPASRFILRAAARFFVHRDDFERAHDILRRSPRVLADPWLLAGEIAIAATAERTSRLIKPGRAILTSGDFSSNHLAELASAIATIELVAGKSKPARKLFERSLVDPTENSVAQGEWASRRIGGVHIDESNLNRPFTFEARAHKYVFEGESKKAIAESRSWLHDQPFSSRPAILGSYLASTIVEDYETGVTFAKAGLRANPNEFMLLNNLAFAEAQSNNVSDALKTLRLAAPARSNETDETVFAATSGLVEYRAGNPERGRLLYKEAINNARNQKSKKLEAMALFFFAMEEIRAETPDAGSAREAALVHVADLPEHEKGPLETRLRDRSVD